MMSRPLNISPLFIHNTFTCPQFTIKTKEDKQMVWGKKKEEPQQLPQFRQELNPEKFLENLDKKVDEGIGVVDEKLLICIEGLQFISGQIEELQKELATKKEVKK